MDGVEGSSTAFLVSLGSTTKIQLAKGWGRQNEVTLTGCSRVARPPCTLMGTQVSQADEM